MKTNNSAKNNQNNSKKKNTIWPFVAFCALGGCVGLFIGILAGFTEGFNFTALKEIAKNVIIYAAPVLLLLVFVFVFIYSLTGYIKSKKAIAIWDNEDEEYIEKVEAKLGIIISMLTIALVMVYSLFGINMYAQFNLVSGDVFMSMLPLSIATLIAMIATIFYNTFIQRACVELIKKINPEKKGDTLSINFQKEWEQSMDEAQKLMLFEAGYRTYKVMNYVLMVAWMICTLGIMFGMGLMPSLVTSALWLTSTITYSVYSYKVEHKSKKR